MVNDPRPPDPVTQEPENVTEIGNTPPSPEEVVRACLAFIEANTDKELKAFAVKGLVALDSLIAERERTEDFRAWIVEQAFTSPDADWNTIRDSLTARLRDVFAERERLEQYELQFEVDKAENARLQAENATLEAERDEANERFKNLSESYEAMVQGHGAEFRAHEARAERLERERDEARRERDEARRLLKMWQDEDYPAQLNDVFTERNALEARLNEARESYEMLVNDVRDALGTDDAILPAIRSMRATLKRAADAIETHSLVCLGTRASITDTEGASEK